MCCCFQVQHIRQASDYLFFDGFPNISIDLPSGGDKGELENWYINLSSQALINYKSSLHDKQLRQLSDGDTSSAPHLWLLWQNAVAGFLTWKADFEVMLPQCPLPCMALHVQTVRFGVAGQEQAMGQRAVEGVSGSSAEAGTDWGLSAPDQAWCSQGAAGRGGHQLLCV